MQDGQVLQSGTAQSLLSDPASRAVRHFFRDIDSAAVLDVAAIAAMPSCLLVNASGPLAALDAVVGDPVYVLDESKRLRGIGTCSEGWIEVWPAGWGWPAGCAAGCAGWPASWSADLNPICDRGYHADQP